MRSTYEAILLSCQRHYFLVISGASCGPLDMQTLLMNVILQCIIFYPEVGSSGLFYNAGTQLLTYMTHIRYKVDFILILNPPSYI